MAAIEDSRPPERDSLVYQTIHNLEIPNLAVTVNDQKMIILFQSFYIYF